MGEGIIVIVRDPLVAVPGDPFDTRRVVPRRLQIVLADDILNFLVVQDTGGVGAGARVGGTRELANAVRRIA